MPNLTDKSTFADKLRQEQLTIMDRAFKIEERKIIFVIALLGIAGFRVVVGPDITEAPASFGRPELMHVWYLAPFVAVFFDILSLLQKYSVRRIGAFLRNYSDEALEKQWELFVTKHRDRVLRYESMGFTILTFLASAWVIFRYVHKEVISSIHLMEWIWLFLLIAGYVAVWRHAIKAFEELDKLNEFSYFPLRHE